MESLKERIVEAKRRLGAKAAHIMAKEIPIESWDSIHLKGKSIFREEQTPSMSWYDQGCCFKDFGNSMTIDFIEFLRKYKGMSFKEAVKKLFEMVDEECDEEELNHIYFGNNILSSSYIYPKDEEANDRSVVESYMIKRGISSQTLDFCNVKQSENGDIAYQFVDINGRLVATKYRVSHAASNSEIYKWRWQTGASNCPLLYGVDKIDITKPLIIVEGLNDRLACVEAGIINVVSIPGGATDKSWFKFNENFLNQFNELIIWADDDEAGQTMIKNCIEILESHRVKVVQGNEQIKEKIKEKSHGKYDKIDANNVLVSCGPETIVEMINNVKDIPNPRLKDLFDYEDIELFNLPYVPTGFKTLDKIIYGNYKNNLVVITGRPGSGKSSLVAQMGIISPLESGENVFIYSGEIPGEILLGNTFRPLAGRNHIIEYDNSDRGVPNGYSVTTEAKIFLREYYRGRVISFDDESGLNSGADKILSDMEYSYKKYGVTFFTLDNLMTIATSTDEDHKYSSQIDFSKKVKMFTRKYPVTVILVAHPKKPGQGQKDVDLYGVAGASELVNLADRVFSISLLKDNPDGDCRITILKDRQTGKVDRSIKLWYDIKSGRIYSDESELNRVYSWEKSFVPDYSEWIKSRLVVNVEDKKEVLG